MAMWSLITLTSLLLIKKNVGYTTCDDTSECSSMVINDNYIYCYGYKACEAASITASMATFCSGYFGCGSYTSSSASNIYTGNALYCDGHSACFNSNISSASFMFCNSQESCRNSTILKSTHLYGEGYWSNYNSKIYNVTYIYGLGYYSFYYANIYVKNFPRTYIMFSGYYSGRNASIYCYSGSQCILTCEGNACTHTTMYCYVGSTCSYSLYNISAVAPKVYTSLSLPMDNELNAMIQANEIQKSEQMQQFDESNSNPSPPHEFQQHQHQEQFQNLNRIINPASNSVPMVSGIDSSIISYGGMLVIVMVIINIIIGYQQCHQQKKSNKNAYTYESI